MKRMALIASLALAALPLPAALGAPGGVPGPPAAHPAKSAAPTAHAVAFVARGVVAAVSAGGGSFVVDVTGGNHFLRRVVAGLPSPQALTVKVDAATTKITKAAKGRAVPADIAVKDRVVVVWKAPRGTTLATLQTIAARRVVDVGPVPTS